MTRIAVYGLKEERDLAAFLRSGADCAVFVCGASGADFVLPSTAKRLAKALPPGIATMLYVQQPDAASVAEAVTASGQNACLFGNLSCEETAKLHQALPSVKLLRIFSGNELLEYSGGEYAPCLGGFVLDCSSAEHWAPSGVADWMMRSPLPVFFMGMGEWLESAVAEFHPFGALLPSSRQGGSVAEEALLKEAVRRVNEA